MNPLDVLKYGHRTVLKTLDGLPEADWQTPGVVGDWSVKDVVAHLASHEQVLVEILQSLLGEAATLGNTLDLAITGEGCSQKFLDHLFNRYGIFNSASEGDEVGVVVGFSHFGAE